MPIRASSTNRRRAKSNRLFGSGGFLAVVNPLIKRRARPQLLQLLLVTGLVASAGIGFLYYTRAATPACTVSSKLVNSCRPWLGAAVGDYPGVSSGPYAQAKAHEARIGRPLDIIHTYHPVGNNQLTSDDKTIAARANTYLFANWKPASSWAKAAGGNATANTAIDRMADSVKSVAPAKIFMTLHHEAENDVSGGGQGCSGITYKGSFGTPAEYRAMWRNVEQRFAARGATNVVWVIDYMNYSGWDCLVDDLYPGNDLVDWVMFNAYSHNSSKTFGNNVQRFVNLMSKYQSSTTNFSSKPWGIVEWNVNNASSTTAKAYYDQAKAVAEAGTYPNLKAYMIFDGVGPDGIEYRAGYNAKSQADSSKQSHYNAFANSSVFKGRAATPKPTATPKPSTPAPTVAATVTPKPSTGIKALTPGTSWQWQLTGTINETILDGATSAKKMYDIDLYDTPAATISRLKAKNITVICYFSAGSAENWRPDYASFPASVKGKGLDGWAGETWLDVRQLSILKPIMGARMDLAVSKGCDGVEPDNVDAYTNSTGFSLAAADQLAYNRMLATEAHARNLSVGLKNDVDQVAQLASNFDWALNEQCYQYNECGDYSSFIGQNKAVFGVEYKGSTSTFCPKANAANYDWLLKDLNLGATPRTACRNN